MVRSRFVNSPLLWQITVILVTFSEHRLPEKVIASRKDWRKELLEMNIGKTALEMTCILGSKMGFEMSVKL